MKTYLIGIQPTGKLHIGNYLGCLKRGLEYQNQGHNVIFLIANYHSLTTDNFSQITEEELKKLGCKNIKHQTPEYTELFFKLCCKMNLGTLQKMPQFKEKSESSEYNLGILLYPVLMAADIIINNPDVVIVGKDQVPHLDLCNDIVKRIGIKKYFNYEFGHVDKVYSLINPDKKMSKSDGENHVLYLFDEDYNSKLKRATATPEGLKNLHIIGNNIGLNCNDYNLNSDLKNAISDKMNELFNIEMAV